MPELKVRYVLMCEEFRQETRGLASLLGFYGGLPDVEIAIRDFTAPTRIAFVINAVPVDGTFNVVMKIIDPKGAVIPTPELKIPMKASRPGPTGIVRRMINSNIALGFGNLVLPMAGNYKVAVLANGEKVYETSFDVRGADPGEFE